MSFLFQSERLGFRNWQIEDFHAFATMNADARVMAFFPSTLNQAQSNTSALKMSHHFTDYGYTYFVTCELATNKFIGFIGLRRVSFESSFTPTVDIGWRLAFDFWGQGYATEGAKQMIEMAPKWNIKTIHSFTPIKNKRSEHVMHKCGMKHVGFFEHPLVEDDSSLKTHTLYRLDF